MRICEFGKNDRECVLLIHPSLVTWDYFEYVIPLLEKHYHLLIPALPGYDPEDDSQFCSVEQTASRLADDILQKGIRYEEVHPRYGLQELRGDGPRGYGAVLSGADGAGAP